MKKIITSISFLFLFLCTLSASAQIDPRYQINWPSNCNTPGTFYSQQARDCLLAGGSVSGLTPNTIPIASTPTTLVDSLISQDVGAENTILNGGLLQTITGGDSLSMVTFNLTAVGGAQISTANGGFGVSDTSGGANDGIVLTEFGSADISLNQLGTQKTYHITNIAGTSHTVGLFSPITTYYLIVTFAETAPQIGTCFDFSGLTSYTALNGQNACFVWWYPGPSLTPNQALIGFGSSVFANEAETGTGVTSFGAARIQSKGDIYLTGHNTIIGSLDGTAGSLSFTPGTASSLISGTIQLSAPSSSGGYQMFLPSAQGSGALTNDGSGNLSWVTSGGTPRTCNTHGCYKIDADGTITEWGFTADLGGSGSTSITLPFTFPTSCDSITVSTVAPTDRITFLNATSGTSGCGTSSFAVGNNGTTASASWIAIGH